VAATLQDVALHAGVSIKTVTNVINGWPHVRPQTRAKVTDALDLLGYVPNLTARSLRSGKTDLIALIIPDLRNAYFAELADSVMRAAEAQGLSVIVEQSGGDRERELAQIRGPRAQMTDGILYSASGVREKESHFLRGTSRPIVLLGEHILDGPTDHVTMQNAEGAYAATRHLIERGRTRILGFGAYLGQTDGSAGLRLTGYLRALAEAGIAPDPTLIIDIEPWYRHTGAEAMERVLASGVVFDGLVAFSDVIALGALRTMIDAGLRVPEDVGVVGFDDIDETRYSQPPLTTIDPGRDEIARVAVQYLRERIQDPNSGIPPRHYLSSFELVTRRSSTGTRAHA
jgi:DNA-binding LacI/PurR family transcriptional regulator